jgi:ribosomal protein L24E
MFDIEHGTYIRVCKYCGSEMPGKDGPITGRALEEDGKLWLFCSSEHKQRWDNGRKTIAELEANHANLD